MKKLPQVEKRNLIGKKIKIKISKFGITYGTIVKEYKHYYSCRMDGGYLECILKADISKNLKEVL